MGNPLRINVPAQLVLRALLEHPSREMHGLEICATAGLRVGTIHPILARFESRGWLDSRWEETGPERVDRPRRRLYRLSPEGAEQAREQLRPAYLPPVTAIPGVAS